MGATEFDNRFFPQTIDEPTILKEIEEAVKFNTPKA